MPVEAAVDASSPASPESSSIGISIVPVMHAADLILPAIVDAGHAPAVDVCPRRPVVDDVVSANVDLANVHVADLVTNSIAKIRAITDIWPIANIVADPTARSRRCWPLQRLVQSEKVSQITGRGPSSASGQVWSVSGQVRSTTGAGCTGPREIRPVTGPAAQTGNAGTCAGAFRQPSAATGSGSRQPVGQIPGL